MVDDAVEVLIGEEGGPDLLRSFRGPVRTVEAWSAGEVMPVLREVEEAVSGGLCAAGFLAYEAASGLDAALSTRDSGDRPLVWFGLFEKSELVSRNDLEWLPSGDPTAPATSRLSWRPSMNRSEYMGKVDRIKRYLGAGESYQVNFTFKLFGDISRDYLRLFMEFTSDYRIEFSSYISAPRFAIISGSPELFFELDNRRIISRPMKGTERRGLTVREDDLLAESLKNSEKNRAENLMIVDMIRNDFGKICDPGTVRVKSLFDVERFWTVLQMTSTVEGTTSASFAQIIEALFPCASVTGAPKVRTMEIIRALETEPRGVYTGCVGYLLPDRHARFSVAIRTAWVDVVSADAEYGVGGGIVWDSSPEQEYEECLLKAGTLTASVPEFDLLETMLWEAKAGYFLLDRHLGRLAGSARYFGYPLSLPSLEAQLQALEHSMPGERCKVRVLIGRDGGIEVERSAISEVGISGDIRVEISKKAIYSNDVFLYHKTTNRVIYQTAIDGSKMDDVILVNERGEVTESTIANIVVKKNGKLTTPPVRCGLLAGTFRDFLIANGEIEEGMILPYDLLESPRILLVNSVQKWTPVTLVTED